MRNMTLIEDAFLLQNIHELEDFRHFLIDKKGYEEKHAVGVIKNLISYCLQNGLTVKQLYEKNMGGYFGDDDNNNCLVEYGKYAIWFSQKKLLLQIIRARKLHERLFKTLKFPKPSSPFVKMTPKERKAVHTFYDKELTLTSYSMLAMNYLIVLVGTKKGNRNEHFSIRNHPPLDRIDETAELLERNKETIRKIKIFRDKLFSHFDRDLFEHEHDDPSNGDIGALVADLRVLFDQEIGDF